MILRYIPYVQTNFVLGPRRRRGAEPFELTKRFVDLTPGRVPRLLAAVGVRPGGAAQPRVPARPAACCRFPFHFLNNNHAMNVRPKNYAWPEFYDHVIDLTKYTFSCRVIAKRFMGTSEMLPQGMNVVRAISSEGFGRIKYYTTIRGLLDTDKSVRDYFEGETTVLPQFYRDRVRRDLGPLWDWLPEGALEHDPNAYLKASAGLVPIAPRAGRGTVANRAGVATVA